MSDSTSLLDAIDSAQGSKEVTANDANNAESIASSFGRRGSTSVGLTWGGYGTSRWYINATATAKANWTQTLTASSTRYVAVDRSLAITENASAFPADKLALYKAVTGTGGTTSYEDHRDPHHIARFLEGQVTIAMADANQTATYEQAMCEYIELTGNNTALRDLVVPLVPRTWDVFANTTTNGVRVIGSSGTGVTIGAGKTARVKSNGTNVVRITADV